MFYPKHQFLTTIKALPRGAQLVLLLGEIDCREGLLLAVQKCKVGMPWYEEDLGLHSMGPPREEDAGDMADGGVE